MINLQDALLCATCEWIVSARDVRGEKCPHCDAQSTLISLARVLNPSPALGAVTFIYSAGRA